MGFRDAKTATIRALRSGDFVHEEREVRAEKNLLAIGEVAPEVVVALVQRATGKDYTTSPHHWDRETPVHIFRPSMSGERWYIKVYFVHGDEGTATFISVHR